MKQAGWAVLSVAVGLTLFGAGATAARIHPSEGCRYGIPQHVATAQGQGEFPIGSDHHYGQFNFSVTQGHNGPEGSFEFNEKNARGQNVQHILARPIDRLSIDGKVAHIEGAIRWHDHAARVRVIATDNGEHGDSITIRVVATEGPDAGKAVYEVGVLTGGGIRITP